MRPFRTLAIASAFALAWAAPAAAASKPRVSWAKCQERCSSGKVQRGGRVKLAGAGFTPGSRVVFSVKGASGRTTRTVRAELSNAKRLSAKVPANALSGRIYLRARGGKRSNAVKIGVAPPQKDNAPSSPRGTPFDGAGMWVWYVDKSNGGDPSAIAQQALGHNVSTVFVKSGDGTTYWDQFTPQLVADLKSRGLRVCAWQYVYGKDPDGEAAVSARAKDAGAECFVIDAESEYEGKYDQAREYVSKLRAAVGRDYPVGLAGFPYVHYHPSYPYSAFLGDGGAQFNVPQVYWKEIGGGVDKVVDTTYTVNRPYGRPIVPIGQTYGDPPLEEIQRFRARIAAQGAAGHSWWSWQETNDAEWAAIGQPVAPIDPPPAQDFVTIKNGDSGDLVLWAQEHLSTAGFATDVDGDFGGKTQAAVTSFQQANGLPATGQVDTATWRKLLEQVPKAARGKPKSADEHARRDEIKKQK
jgi:peptidoglycan hydrolase-like protein with peptidoglycan-binding domain